MSEEESFEPKERNFIGRDFLIALSLIMVVFLISSIIYYFVVNHNPYIESSNECDGDCQMHRFQWFCQDRGFAYGINDIDKEDSGQCCYDNHTCEKFA